jgi:flagellar hook protein FlgE
MAGFNTAVTGLKASTTMLDVAGNNIANSSTAGFKSSRTEFGDIYATAVVGAGSSNVAGSGVTVTDIAQDFKAGTIEFTNNNLDLAINGSGFFQLDDGQGGVTYTRAGAFELNKDGFIVSKNGKFLQGYGLDADGNRLPIGDMAVTEKESPPKATESIDLSFNIDAREDPTKLLTPYDKDEPSSFTYTTTVRSYDSLGNEHTIKYNFVEQRPQKEVHRLSWGTTTDAPDGFYLSYAKNETGSNPTSPNVDIADFNEPQTIVVGGETVPNPAYGGVSPDGWKRIDRDALAELQKRDPRIFDVEWDSEGTGDVRVVLKSEATEVGDLASTLEYVEETSEEKPISWVDSNEKHYFNLSGPLAAGEGVVNIKIAGVDIQLDPGTEGMTLQQVQENITAKRSAIIEANPLVENVSFDEFANDGGGAIVITYKADAGNVPDLNLAVSQNSGGDNTVFDLADDGSILYPSSKLDGDNSYRGVYRTYAYLNNDEALNLGKVRDPGEASGTEVGPVVIKFDPSSGLLTSVNGKVVTPGAPTPKLTIFGADPANADTEITLDLDGSTQFASASIVKAQLQDGYTKGDLIGVTFAPTGEMIASFSNGQNQSLGVVAIATFENQSGLQPNGDTEWVATLTSGDAVLNPPGTGLNGTLRSAALEASNVDLSAELVKLIEGQRNFQANSKTLETLNTVTQTILQI